MPISLGRRRWPVAAAGNVEGETKRFAVWKDMIGLDSEYDYDPVWAKCLELNIAPSFHSGARRSGATISAPIFLNCACTDGVSIAARLTA